MITTKIQRPVSLWELCDPWLERLGLLLRKIQNPVSLLILLAALCLFAGVFLSAVGAQEKKPNFMRVEGHVYEPAKVEPTDERINQLKLPTGFRIARFAEMVNPRMIAVAPDGTVYVTAREPGTLVILRDADQDGVAEMQRVVAEKKMLHGLALHNGRMYLATVKEVFVADVKPDGTLSELRTLINDLPDGGQHPNRTLAVGPDQMLYISVGSTCNACRETNDEHATLVRTNLDGSGRQVFASGLRNTIGFGWHPVSRRLFGLDHGIDWLGDNDQSEELNELIAGTRYGWPYVYADGKLSAHPAPPKEYTAEMWRQLSKEPALLYTPHSAPMQMAFYTGQQFPEEYRTSAFAAMRGSWNRTPPSGYEVVRIKFSRAGVPTAIEPFLTGFLIKGGAAERRDAQFARLAGLAVLRDGALLVGDDTNGVLYRVSYGQTQASNRAESFPRVLTSQLPGMQGQTRLTVTSAAFGHNQPIPTRHSAYGEGLSPALAWSGVPAEARSVVVLVEDPDALSPKPFLHWSVVNLPTSVKTLPAGVSKEERLAQWGNAMQGATHTSQLGYYGPKPPADDPPHRYHFQIFALDTQLTLPSGFNRPALLNALRGHVVAFGEIVGTYQRQQPGQPQPLAEKN